ncbi:MAG: DUF1015 domain-containing protein [Clostridiales bacterium]|nr:DUF1015 domain-containing protein [Clostridiales bacterium]
MAEIQPFRGLRYNPDRIRLQDVITEPYDRITPAMQDEYYRKNPYNIVRVILGKDEDPEHPEKDKYRRADVLLKKWQEDGVFVREKRRALYLYEQEFQSDGEQRKRLGLIARVKLEDFASKKVLPHEKTFPKHKEDRLRLLRATQTNTEQIFLLYSDGDKEAHQAISRALERIEAAADIRDEDGFRHCLWIVQDEKDISRIQQAMADKILIIADGHHRYETSLNYRAEMATKLGYSSGIEPWNYVMMTLFDLNDPGLVILPTYRLVKNLEKLDEEGLRSAFSDWFEISGVDWSGLDDRAGLAKVREIVSTNEHTFALFLSGLKKFLVLRLKNEEILDEEGDRSKSAEWKRLDVAILHFLIIDRLGRFTAKPFVQEESVSYIRRLEEGLEKVEAGEWQMIFLLKPCSLQQVRQVVEKGELMPHKSTDFFPKLKSGLVLCPLDE